MKTLTVLRGGIFFPLSAAIAGQPVAAPEGWSHVSPREEVAPKFSFDPTGGPDRTGSFDIASDQREGLIGHWKRTFPIKGGGVLPLQNPAQGN